MSGGPPETLCHYPGAGTVAAAGTRLDAHLYENELVQTIDLQWGRITRIHTLEDTQKLAAALERLAAAGTAEAQMAPIVDGARVADAA